MYEKKHKIKQDKAIEKAIKKLMDEVIHSLLVTGTEFNKPLPSKRKVFKNNSFYHYYFIGKTLDIFINYIPILQDKLYFNFPDVCKIIEEIEEIYPDFDSSIIDEVVYTFEYKNIVNTLEINAENSKLWFRNCSFGENVYINSASETDFASCNLPNTKKIHIYSNDIYLTNCRLGEETDVFLKGIDTNISHLVMYNSNRFEIHTSLLSIKNSKLLAKHIFLDTDMTESIDSNIIANYTITIYDDYNDEIKGIKAPCVMYNGVDISKSEGLHIHKEKDKLLATLKNVKTFLEEIIEKDKIELIKNYEEKVNESPVKEIINRKNI